MWMGLLFSEITTKVELVQGQNLKSLSLSHAVVIAGSIHLMSYETAALLQSA